MARGVPGTAFCNRGATGRTTRDGPRETDSSELADREVREELTPHQPACKLSAMESNKDLR